MEFFSKIIVWFQQTSAKDIRRYMYMTLAGVVVVVMALLFFVYSKSNDLVAQTKKLETLVKNSIPLLQKYEKLQQDEALYSKLFEENKDMDMKSYFEGFCKIQGINPEPGWVDVHETLNPKFEEVSVKATFKGQTAQKLVLFLEAVQKEHISRKKILYAKNVHIKKDSKDSVISFDLTIATIRMKKE